MPVFSSTSLIDLIAKHIPGAKKTAMHNGVIQAKALNTPPTFTGRKVVTASLPESRIVRNTYNFSLLGISLTLIIGVTSFAGPGKDKQDETIRSLPNQGPGSIKSENSGGYYIKQVAQMFLWMVGIPENTEPEKANPGFKPGKDRNEG